MSVPKSRRKKSRFEVFHNMSTLQKELIMNLMTDFGITRMTNLGEAQFLDIKFERIVRYRLTESGHLVKRINPKTITRERRKPKKYRKMVDRGILTETDVSNSFKSWYKNYEKIMSYRTKKNMLALYKELFGCYRS